MRPSRLHSTTAIAACVLAPIVAIALIGWHYAALVRLVLPVDPDNIAVLRHMLSVFVHVPHGGNSWGPMLQALDVLKGHDGNALYETLFFNQHVRFQYPPTSLLTLDFLSRIGLGGSRILNAINSAVYVMNAATAGFLAWLLFSLAPDRAGRCPMARPYPAAMAVLAAATAFLFYPLMRADILGQIQLWIDLLFTAALVLWLLEKRLFAGILIGLACTIKPQLGLLLLWALLWRDWSFGAGILAGLVPLSALSLARYGWHDHVAYLGVLSFLSRHGESYFANNSVNGILNWYLSPDDSMRWHDHSFTPYIPTVYVGTLMASLAALSIILAAPLLLRRRRRAHLGDLAVAAICTIVGSPVAWEHHYGILFPLYLVALRSVLDIADIFRRRLAMASLLLSWILVADFISPTSLLNRTPFIFVQAYCFFGAIVLLGLFLTSGREAPCRQPAREG